MIYIHVSLRWFITIFFRTGAAHLIAEICQNNEYCQQHLVKVHLLFVQEGWFIFI